jgi:folate-dependent phosphoribosylglycinamide formyltransferase PurN
MIDLIKAESASFILLTSIHSTYGAQIIQAARMINLDIQVVFIENVKARGGINRFRHYWRRYGPGAALWRAAEVSWFGCVKRFRGNHRLPTIEQVMQNEPGRIEVVTNLNDACSRQHFVRYSHLPALLGGTSILKPDTIRQLPLGILNAHNGLLPDYRGNYPDRWALLNGDPCGVSVYRVDDGLDTGPVLARKIVLRSPHESLSDFEERLSSISAELLAATALKYCSGEVIPEPQNLQICHTHGLMGVKDNLRLHRQLARYDHHSNRIENDLIDRIPFKFH